MVKAHTPINWENEPSYNTPLNAANLNKMDSEIGILDDRIIEQDTIKLDKATANTMVKAISFDENTGVFTITLLNGSTTKIDTKLEKVVVNFGYDATTQQIILNLVDGTTQYIDLSALITQYEFVDSDTIGWEVTTDGKVKAKILDGSITENMLQPNYLAEIKGESAKAEANAIKSQSYAVGGTASRQNEDIDNARYYYEQAKSISESFSGALVPMGTVAFEDLPSLEDAVAGWMYNISNEFVTTDEFKEGAGHTIPLGANIFKTVDNFWDLLSGSSSDLIVDTVEGNNPTIDNSTDGNLTYLKNSGYTKQDETPTPDTPIHIDGNGDKGYFDGKLYGGYYDTTTGVKTETTSGSTVCSNNYMETKENDVVELIYEESADYLWISFYDSDKNYLSRANVGNAKEVNATTPTNAKYFTFTIQKNSGITPSTAKHICVTINGNYAVRVKTCGKNIFDYRCIGNRFSNNATGTTHTYSNEEFVITRVANIYSGIYSYADELNVLKGKKIKMTLDVKTDTSGMNISVALARLSLIEKPITTGYARYSFEFDLTDVENAYPLTIYGNAVAGNMYIKDIMFEDITNREATDDTYEPYTETQALIPISSPLYDGDYIEVFADGSGEIVRNMKSVVYDGSDDEVWHYAFYGSDFFHISTGNQAKRNEVAFLRNSHFTPGFIYEHGYAHVDTNRNICVFISSLGSNVADWKNWLKSNHMTVVYKLETPTTESLTAEQVAEFKKLQTFKGVTNVIADGEVTVRYYCNNDSGDTVGMLQNIANNSVSKSSIANNLTTTTEGMVLDATQGKALNDKISTINSNLEWKTLTHNSASVTSINGNFFVNIITNSDKIKNANEIIVPFNHGQRGTYIKLQRIPNVDLSSNCATYIESSDSIMCVECIARWSTGLVAISCAANGWGLEAAPISVKANTIVYR